ncbi:MAG: helix-turn-helix domain-containing protein [Nitrospirae bacterium]|nr:MAG: helix-turn-helix domain-containing protein [Nitrospirota bacterium]
MVDFLSIFLYNVSKNKKGVFLLGDYLRGEREKAGLTIEALSKKTLIRKTYLEALENEDYETINGDVYVRGYIRAYLGALGISPEEALKLYEEDIKRKQPSPVQQPLPPQKKSKIYYLPAGLLGIAIIIVLLLFNGHDKKTTTNTIAHVSRPSIDVLIPVEQAEAKFENKEVLEIDTLEETWIYLVIDNNLKYSMLLEPGEKKKWTADKGFFIKIGNAGGIEITYNGKRYSPPGQKGQVVRLNLPQDLSKLTPYNTPVPSE